MSESRVSLELPRAAILSSANHVSLWELPAERVARALDADFDRRTLAGGVSLRSLSPAATEWAASNAADLEHWARFMPDGAVGGALKVGDLLQWLSAIRKMERMVGAGARLSGAFGNLDPAAFGGQLEEISGEGGPLLIQWLEPTLVLAR